MKKHKHIGKIFIVYLTSLVFSLSTFAQEVTKDTVKSVQQKALPVTNFSQVCKKNSEYLKSSIQSELTRVRMNHSTYLSLEGYEMDRIEVSDCIDCNDHNEQQSGLFNLMKFSKHAKNITNVSKVENKGFIKDYNTNIECIASAMQDAPNARFYVCSKGESDTQARYRMQTSPYTYYPKPCVTKEYANLIYNSLNAVSECLGVSTKEMFPLLARESGFVTNISSPSGVMGISQISGDTLTAINNMDTKMVRVYDKDLKKYVTTSDPFWKYSYLNLKNKPECESLKSILQEPKHVNTSCERVSMPPNPDLNLLNGIRNYLWNKDQVNEVINEWTANTKQKISDQDKEELAIILSRWMYNGGAALKNYFLTFTKLSFKDPKTGVLKKYQFKNIDDFKKKFEPFVRVQYPGKAHRKAEVGNYPDDIQNKLAHIKKQAGGSCFEN